MKLHIIMPGGLLSLFPVAMMTGRRRLINNEHSDKSIQPNSNYIKCKECMYNYKYDGFTPAHCPYCKAFDSFSLFVVYRNY